MGALRGVLQEFLCLLFKHGKRGSGWLLSERLGVNVRIKRQLVIAS